MKKTLFLSAILGAALCSTAMGAITEWDNLSGVTIGAGTTQVGHLENRQTWNTAWSIVMSVDASSLTSEKALTLMGLEIRDTKSPNPTGLIEGATILSDGKLNFTTWSKGDINTTNAADFSSCTNVIFILSRDGSGNSNNLTLKAYKDTAFDTFEAAPQALYTLQSTDAQNFGSFELTDVVFGGKGDFSKYSHTSNKVTFADDSTTGTYTVNKAGYSMGAMADSSALLTFLHEGNNHSLTWNGTSSDSVWDTQTAPWNGAEGSTAFTQFDDVTFGAGADLNKNISVVGDVRVLNMTVQDDYTFSTADESTLKVNTLTIEGGSSTISGSLTLNNLTLTGGSLKLTGGTTTLTGSLTGSNGQTVSVGTGASLEMNDATQVEVILAGGTVQITSTADFNGQHFGTLTLTKDSTLDLSTKNSGLINKNGNSFVNSTLNLGNNNTLTIKGAKRFCIMDAETTGKGTIDFTTNAAYLQVAHSGVKNHIADLSGVVAKLNGTHVVISSGNTLKIAGLDSASYTNASFIETEGTNGTPTLTLVGDGKEHTFHGKFTAQVNLSMTGAGTQNFNLTANTTLNSLTAEAGAQNFYLNNHTLTTRALTLSGGEVNVFADSNEADVAQITTTTLTVNADTTMEANLVIANGGTLTFADGAVLTMGCTVSIGNDVTVVLTKEMVDSIATGTWVEIIASVDGIATLGQHATFVGAEGVTLDQPTAYHLTQIGDKIYITPEPATTTLSLLALAALAARRKRH